MEWSGFKSFEATTTKKLSADCVVGLYSNNLWPDEHSFYKQNFNDRCS